MFQKSDINVLVVEDNTGDQLLITELLHFSPLKIGSIHIADSLEKAILLLAEQQIDIILLDLSLPDSSGIDSFSKIKLHAEKIAVIILSGLTDQTLAIDAIKLGAQDFLIKADFDEKLLEKTIQYSIERNRNRWQIEKQEALFRALIEKSPDTKALISPGGDILYCTPSIKNVLGYNNESWVGKHVSDLVHPDDLPIIFTEIEAVISDPNRHSIFQVKIRHKNGEFRYCEKTITNLLHDEYVQAIVCNFWDITEKITATKQVALNEKRFRSLVQSGSDIITVIGLNAVCSYASPTIKKVLGYPPDFCIGKNAFDYIHPEDKKQLIEKFNDIPYQGQLEVLPFRFKNSNGEWRWMESVITNLLNDPAVKGIVANSRDITERKIAEDQRKQSETKYRNLFDLNPASIIIWDPATLKILEVNQKAVEEYGYSKEEFLNMTILDYRKKCEFSKVRSLAKSFHSGATITFTGIWEHYNKSGKLMHMKNVSHLVLYNDQNVVLALLENITEKLGLEKVLEQERKKRYSEITDAVITAQENERKEIGFELHDNVNQILASIRLYLGMVKSEARVDHPLLEETDKLLMSAITEVRNLSHGLIPPSMHELELRESLHHIIELTTRGCSLQIDLDIGGFDESLLSDKLKLTIYRIVQEQLNNILKYAEAKSILLRLSRENDLVLLTIKDDGKGFDTSKRLTGVGFMNIRTRASLFNGKMDIVSSPGKGCEMSVLFN